ncbi:DUF3558 family protein [Actinosynnema sp. CA-248983]
MRTSASRLALPLAVLGLALVGCSTGGTPSPATTTTSTATSKASPTTTSGSSSGGSLASYDTCKALEDVAAQFKLTDIEEEGTQQCGAQFSPTVGVGLKAWPSKGIADATGAGNQQITDIKIGPRNAKLIEKGASDTLCAVAVEVNKSSRVDVIASANASLAEACDAARKVAEAIEPKLPK